MNVLGQQGRCSPSVMEVSTAKQKAGVGYDQERKKIMSKVNDQVDQVRLCEGLCWEVMKFQDFKFSKRSWKK